MKELTRGWEDIRQRSLIAGGDWKSLPALSELSHPAIQVCQDFDTNPASPKYERHKEATQAAGYPVVEARDLKTGPGWRAAVIVQDGVSWIVHADTHDRFHAGVSSRFGGQLREVTEPTELDFALRKLKLAETEVMRSVKEWQEHIILVTLTAFRKAFKEHPDGREVKVMLPCPPSALLQSGIPAVDMELTISVIAEEPQGTEEGHEIGETLAEVNLKFDSWKFVGAQGGSSAYARGVETILLTTILPILDSREETWTKEPAAHYGLDGSLRFSIEMSRMRALQIVFAAENEGLSAEASGQATRADVHHFVTGEALKSAIAEQKPLRAACGYWFVPARFPDGLPLCDDCSKQGLVIRFLEQMGAGPLQR
ncbi:DUF3039 domain-containing protein [Arthrobacter sp. NPDC093125]|uniref:DUF3039 domain-containing protein n=1 Tax=Arthrobacter sp. NPDC093125 TaxID=3363944 RepID=UPI0038228BA9